ncbi:hypothetical protein GCM10010360_35190 [Streptomyces nogalater]
MPTHLCPPAPASPARGGSVRRRRPDPVIRGILVVALMLCAVIHHLPQETPRAVAVPAAASSMAVNGDPHGPHVPHEAEDCAAAVIVRTVGQPTVGLSPAATVLIVLVAVPPARGSPLLRHVSRRRRRTRTGRLALVRTSRWRI